MRSEPPREPEGASSEQRSPQTPRSQQSGANQALHLASGGPTDESDDPFVDDQLTATLSGDWPTGGVLEFLYAGQRRESIMVASRRWTFLAALFMAAIDAEDSHWGNSFSSTENIKAILKRKKAHQFAIDNAVHRLANQVRASLEKMTIREYTRESELTSAQWAKRLIVSKKGMGYRIAVPPRNLKLFIGNSRYVAA